MNSLLQTPTWADFKARHGWQAFALGEQLGLKRTLPLRQTFLYAPELTYNEKKIGQLMKSAKTIGEKEQAFVFRLEFLEPWSDATAQMLQQSGLQKAFEEVQPEFRQRIPLEGGKDAILAQMKQKGRYNIRLAERHGVSVTNETDTAIFYELFLDTAKRDHFAIRDKAYFADLLETLHQSETGELLVAWHNNRPLAAIILTYFDTIASYLYGASSSENRELMAPYLLHWQAMERAKAKGCTIYDLLAIAPSNEMITQLPKPLQTTSYKLQTKYQGITRFKQQFGGQSVHLLGSWDLVLKPLHYQIFKLSERWRRQ